MVLTVSFALSPVIGLSCHCRPCDTKYHHGLDAGVEASGPHDFAVRSDAVRLTTSKRPSHPVPTSVAIARAPLFSEQDGRAMLVIWLQTQAEHFSRDGWTRSRVICPSPWWDRCRQRRSASGCAQDGLSSSKPIDQEQEQMRIAECIIGPAKGGPVGSAASCEPRARSAQGGRAERVIRRQGDCGFRRGRMETAVYPQHQVLGKWGLTGHLPCGINV